MKALGSIVPARETDDSSAMRALASGAAPPPPILSLCPTPPPRPPAPPTPTATGSEVGMDIERAAHRRYLGGQRVGLGRLWPLCHVVRTAVELRGLVDVRTVHMGVASPAEPARYVWD